jgi:hypothetical protein
MDYGPSTIDFPPSATIILQFKSLIIKQPSGHENIAPAALFDGDIKKSAVFFYRKMV